MIKLFILSMILPMLAGPPAWQGGPREAVAQQFVYAEQSPSTFPKEVQTFINRAFSEADCNSKAAYKIQKESTSPITNLHGDTVFVYTVEFRVFGEQDQRSFNGYENAKKFRNRSITVRQAADGLSVSNISCENKKAR